MSSCTVSYHELCRIKPPYICLPVLYHTMYCVVYNLPTPCLPVLYHTLYCVEYNLPTHVLLHCIIPLLCRIQPSYICLLVVYNAMYCVGYNLPTLHMSSCTVSYDYYVEYNLPTPWVPVLYHTMYCIEYNLPRQVFMYYIKQCTV